MKSVILITARLKSRRLPMKAIKEIKGKPMIVHLIDRLKIAELPEEIVLCTSPLSQDDPLEEIAERENIFCYRGHPEDVLFRLFSAARSRNADAIINCMADNPFTDPEYIDRLLAFHIKSNNDYSYTEGLPLGTFSYALSAGALEKACRIKEDTDTEIWGAYFTETDIFKSGKMVIDDPTVRWPELRLTVDTSEDFELVERIFDELYEPGEVFCLRRIIGFLKENPGLLRINRNIRQRKGNPIKIRRDENERA